MRNNRLKAESAAPHKEDQGNPALIGDDRRAIRQALGRVNCLIVYPGIANALYDNLARRLASACEENLREILLCRATRLVNLDPGLLDGATMLVVDPLACFESVGDKRARLSSRMSATRKRVMVLSEALKEGRLAEQLRLPVHHDALLDVGFVSQEEKLHGLSLPYHFLFDGPTYREKQMIEQLSPSQRRIPWALIGHRRRDSVRLVAELVEGFDPGGFVFLPRSDGEVPVSSREIKPLKLASVLSETNYYVWGPYQDPAYYESSRFVEALVTGAVPCKIDGAAAREQLGIPGIFPSVAAFCEHIDSEGFASMLNTARDYYLDKGLLADHLKGVLARV